MDELWSRVDCELIKTLEIQVVEKEHDTPDEDTVHFLNYLVV